MKLPKKRYIAAALMSIYVISKVIVSFTQNPNDDDIPDRIKDIVMRIAMLDNNQGSNEHVSST